MKKGFLTLCVALMAAFVLCGSALASEETTVSMADIHPVNGVDGAWDTTINRHIVYGGQTAPVTNRSNFQIGLGETAEDDEYTFYDFLLKNPTDQTDRTLMALVYYSPNVVFNQMYQADPQHDYFHFLGTVCFMDATLAPGEQLRITGTSGIVNMYTPYLLVQFENEADMADFESQIQFEPPELQQLDGPGSYRDETALHQCKASAEFIYKLEYESKARTDIVSIGNFFDGAAAVEFRDGTWGYIDLDGNILAGPGLYTSAGPFSEGKGVVTTFGDKDSENWDARHDGEIGFVDRQGIFTPFQDNGIIEVTNAIGQNWAYNDGYVYIRWGGDTPGALFDAQGKLVIDNAEGPVKDGVVSVTTNDQPGHIGLEGIDIYGEGRDQILNVPGMDVRFTASPTQFLSAGSWDVYSIGTFDDGLAWATVANDIPGLTDKLEAARKETSWDYYKEYSRVSGFIDLNGKMVIEPQYASFWVAYGNSFNEIFTNGIACVQNVDGKWGGIDTQGNTVVPFQYDTGFRFGGDGQLARVIVDGKAGYIGRTGHTVIPAIYESSGSDACSSGGVVAVSKGGKVGLLDLTGKEVAPFRYDGINSFGDLGWAHSVWGCVFTMIPNPIG